MNASTIAQDSFASGKLAADNSELKKTKQPDPVLQHRRPPSFSSTRLWSPRVNLTAFE
jgi:hypothetical protein